MTAGALARSLRRALSRTTPTRLEAACVVWAQAARSDKEAMSPRRTESDKPAPGLTVPDSARRVPRGEGETTIRPLLMRQFSRAVDSACAASTTRPVVVTRWQSDAVSPASCAGLQGKTAVASAAFAIAASPRTPTWELAGAINATTLGTPEACVVTSSAGAAGASGVPIGTAAGPGTGGTTGPCGPAGGPAGATGPTAAGAEAASPGQINRLLGKPNPTTAIATSIASALVQRCPGVMELRTRSNARSVRVTDPTIQCQTMLTAGS